VEGNLVLGPLGRSLPTESALLEWEDILREDYMIQNWLEGEVWEREVVGDGM
jgi:hypothetical protein